MRHSRHAILSRCQQLGRRWFSILFGLLGIAGLVGYIASYPTELSRVRELAVLNVALLSLLVIVGHLFAAMKLHLSATIFDIDLSYWEAWMMLESGSLINIIPLSAMGFRALYLKRVRGMKYVNFGLGTLVIVITNLASSGILGILGLLKLALDGKGEISSLLFALFAGYIVGPLVVLGVTWWVRQRGLLATELPREGSKPRWWHTVYRSLVSGIEVILTQPRAVAQFFVLNLLTSLVICTRFWLIGTWLGYLADFASGLVLQGASQATNLITILPSGIVGLREAFTGLGLTGLGGAAISGVMIAAIDRAVATTWIVLLGSISLGVLYRRIARAEASDPVRESRSAAENNECTVA